MKYKQETRRKMEVLVLDEHLQGLGWGTELASNRGRLFFISVSVMNTYKRQLGRGKGLLSLCFQSQSITVGSQDSSKLKPGVLATIHIITSN